MLVLDRREGERIVIDGGIIVTIAGVSANGRRVKVGIEAPRGVRIMREEIAATPHKQRRG